VAYRRAQITLNTRRAAMSDDSALKQLDRLVGTWTTEATHPAMPGVVVHGNATIEWLEGRQFLVIRAVTDHPKFPDSLAVIGHTAADRVDEETGGRPVDSSSPMTMHYFDSRGVFRKYETSIDEKAWRWTRIVSGFSQRFTGTFADGGATIVGQSELREDDSNWKGDLSITYRRRT
jgi:hypothetical protein